MRASARSVPRLVPARVAIGLNARFVPASARASHVVGASGFASNAAELLAKSGMFAGFLVYERLEGESRPSLVTTRVRDYPGVLLRFNFGMPRAVLQDAIRVALRCLRHGSASRVSATGTDRAGVDREPVLYYQSNTLLPFHPPRVPFLVTHHGPFAREICRSFGRRFAVDAFRGGAEKVEHLVRMQSLGLRVLRAAPRGVALELAGVQERCLLHAGIDRARVLRTAPPWDLVDAGGQASGERLGAAAGVAAESPDAIHLVTMVARADTFKNLDRLVDAANELTRGGVAVRLSIFAGSSDDEPMRARLAGRVSHELRARTRIVPRMSHEDLTAYVRRHRAGCIFVCTSWYETFGLTPLEAMLSGMVTLVPNSPAHIGVVEYTAERYRYHPSVRGLTEAVHRLAACRRRLTLLGEEQRHYARRLLLMNHFVSTMRRAVDRI
jgi:glycosyltransferase involved in cell wall biosynthesis